MSKNNFVIFVIAAFVWVGVNLANFKILSTTTKMASIPPILGNIIKLIKTLSNGLKELGGPVQPEFFLMY
jgi:hypothetical protein